ncbi:MAG: 2-amino-4-hydroxy-6-hydroxymethyldihydropteridine diphosphokinase [Pseudomonadota bacterium]
MTAVYLSIGSNIDRARNVFSAAQSLRDAFSQVIFSPVYQCAPIGFDGDDFYNLAAQFDSSLSPEEIHWKLREIESEHGRRRGRARFASRELDLDILLYGESTIEAEEFAIPRADIIEYAFVLKPLCDIASNVRHPTIGKSIGELWYAMSEGRRMEQDLRQVEIDLNIAEPA